MRDADSSMKWQRALGETGLTIAAAEMLSRETGKGARLGIRLRNVVSRLQGSGIPGRAEDLRRTAEAARQASDDLLRSVLPPPRTRSGGSGAREGEARAGGPDQGSVIGVG